jgi:hypothetical protein
VINGHAIYTAAIQVKGLLKARGRVLTVSINSVLIGAQIGQQISSKKARAKILWDEPRGFRG